VTITSKEFPRLRLTYKVHFGQLTVSNITSSFDSLKGWDASADIRFSDGVTEYRLIYTIYREDKLIFSREYKSGSIALHGKGTISYNLPGSEILPFGDDITLKVFLWNQDFVPLVSNWSWHKSNLVETTVYKLVTSAAEIKAGEEYVIVSAVSGSANKALTNQLTAVSGVDSLEGVNITVEDGYITSEVTDRMIWEASAASAGLYLVNVNPGAGAGTYSLARQNYSGSNPVPLKTGGDGFIIDDIFNRWNFSDVSTADSTVGMYLAEGNYILDPQSDGFCVYYTNSGQSAAVNARPLRFFVKSTEFRPVG
jgi:hypothetical protein